MPPKIIGLFVEDEAQDIIVSALVKKIAGAHGIEVQVKPAGVVADLLGGHGNVKTEFRKYLRDVDRDRRRSFDLVIVATDANCRGFKERLAEMKKEVHPSSMIDVAYAIPDPHIERWLLLDSKAFKKALGRGCKPPDLKCEKDRYKEALRRAVYEAKKFWPDLGGVEYAKDIVQAIDLDRIRNNEKDVDAFVHQMEAKMKEWAASE